MSQYPPDPASRRSGVNTPGRADEPGRADTFIGSADTIASPGLMPDMVPHPELLVGQRIGSRYELLQLLGSGGMGAVYLARDYELDELIAIKMLHEGVAESRDAIELLRQEVRLARRVTHYNVARIFELGEHLGRRFLTMEYIDGQALSAVMRKQKRLSLSQAMDILTAVCRGLQAAHDAGVIHRDVKPDNVLVANRGRVVISDFGIARAARGGRLVDPGATPAGTPAYMAPEQLTGHDVSTRSDVYALGVVAFEMLTGQLPWKPHERSLAQLGGQAPDPRQVAPELPETLAQVIVRALQPRPEERMASATAFAEELGTAVATTTWRMATPRPLTMPAQDASAKRALAVLPFQNRGKAEDDYLASGFTEDLIDCLCSIGELRVLSRGATARFAGDPREPHEIGRDLGVSLVIEGSLQRSGEIMQIKVRAINVDDGAQIWTQRYRVSPEELLTTSDEMARALASSLAATSADSQVLRSCCVMPSTAATEAYLRAKDAYRRLGVPSLTMNLFAEAVRLAGDNPLVQSGYAMALLRAWMYGGHDDPTTGERAREAAERAISAAPELGEAHMAMGLLHLHLGDPVSAVKEFRTTISLTPSMAEAHSFLGELLAEMARIPEAILRLDTAARIDPTLPHPRSPLRRMAALLKDWDRAYELSKAAAGAAQTAFGWMLSMRIAAYRDDQEYLAIIAKHVDELPDDPYGMKPWISAQLAVYRRLKPAVEVYPLVHPTGQLKRWSRRRLANQWQIRAEIAGFAGDHDIVLDSIRQAIDAGLIDLLWLDHCPLLDNLRPIKQFLELRKRVEERAHTAYDAFWS